MSAPSAGLETNLLHLPVRFTNPRTQNAKQELILRQDRAKFHDIFSCNCSLCTKNVIYLRTYYHSTSLNQKSYHSTTYCSERFNSECLQRKGHNYEPYAFNMSHKYTMELGLSGTFFPEL